MRDFLYFSFFYSSVSIFSPSPMWPPLAPRYLSFALLLKDKLEASTQSAVLELRQCWEAGFILHALSIHLKWWISCWKPFSDICSSYIWHRHVSFVRIAQYAWDRLHDKYQPFKSLPVTWCTNSLTFNSCTFCPHCIYVFCIYLRTNSDLCHLHHKLIGFF